MDKKTKSKVIEMGILAIVLSLVLGVKIFDYYVVANGEASAIEVIESNKTVGSDKSGQDTSKQDEGEVVVELVTVHVAGAVLNPDIYDLPIDSRVKDAIDEAGGFTGEADQSVINLAGKIYDTQKIVVYKIGEVPSQPIENPIGLWTLQDLNEADASRLMEIKGIGESMAGKILDYRKENGPFNSIEELLSISGIGEKKLESMKEAFESSIKK